jgi:hypothetical protein
VFHQFIHLVVGNIAVFEDKSLADEVIRGVVQVLGQKSRPIDWLEARVIFSDDMLLDKLHSATNLYYLAMDVSVSSAMICSVLRLA